MTGMSDLSPLSYLCPYLKKSRRLDNFMVKCVQLTVDNQSEYSSIQLEWSSKLRFLEENIFPLTQGISLSALL